MARPTPMRRDAINLAYIAGVFGQIFGSDARGGEFLRGTVISKAAADAATAYQQG